MVPLVGSHNGSLRVAPDQFPQIGSPHQIQGFYREPESFHSFPLNGLAIELPLSRFCMQHSDRCTQDWFPKLVPRNGSHSWFPDWLPQIDPTSGFPRFTPLIDYSRVAQSDLPTPAPGSLRISPRPQMEGGRLGEVRGKVFMGFYIRKHSQNIAKFGPNQGQQSVNLPRAFPQLSSLHLGPGRDPQGPWRRCG